MFYVLLFTRKLSSAGYTENFRSHTMLCIQPAITFVYVEIAIVISYKTLNFYEYYYRYAQLHASNDNQWIF